MSGGARSQLEDFHSAPLRPGRCEGEPISKTTTTMRCRALVPLQRPHACGRAPTTVLPCAAALAHRGSRSPRAPRRSRSLRTLLQRRRRPDAVACPRVGRRMGRTVPPSRRAADVGPVLRQHERLMHASAVRPAALSEAPSAASPCSVARWCVSAACWPSTAFASRGACAAVGAASRAVSGSRSGEHLDQRHLDMQSCHTARRAPSSCSASRGAALAATRPASRAAAPPRRRRRRRRHRSPRRIRRGRPGRACRTYLAAPRPHRGGSPSR